MATPLHALFEANRTTGSLKLRRLEPADCFAALAEGFDDALEMPTYPAFVGLFYALAGVALVSVSSFADALQLAFPLASGFALIGPFVAVGLYEMSRRRERGLEPDWRAALAVARSPALPSILALGLLLFAVFAGWIGAAQLLYVHLYGPDPPAALMPFLRDVLTTGRGWLLIVDGGSIGFCFAALALCLSVIAFPLMIDRDVRLVPAIGASLRLSRKCPAAIALWGLIVATALVFGALTLFVGLAVVVPVLGHSTWRLYRRAVERAAQVEPPVDQRRARGRDRRSPWPSSESIRNAGDQANAGWRSRSR
jgi:uncharacterized membrane protein